MATWFATASGNINSAGRWNSLPNGTGTALTWPPAVNDVLVTNGFTVTVNVSVNLGSGAFRGDAFGGATPTGSFIINNELSITGDIYGGQGASTVTFGTAGGTATIIGTVFGDSGASTSVRYAVQNQSTGTLTITGIVRGGTGGSNGRGVNNSSSGTINVIGDVIASDASNNFCINNNTSGTITVVGNGLSTGGRCVLNNAGGSITVSGYVQASNASDCLNNAGQGIVTVGETRSASNGRGAVTGPFRYASTTALVHKTITADGSVLTMKPVSAFTLPSEATVRNGVAFGADKVGTLTGCNRYHRMAP